MVSVRRRASWRNSLLSVLALSSRFDGREFNILCNAEVATDFQYSLCRVVLMVSASEMCAFLVRLPFSTRSVESF